MSTNPKILFEESLLKFVIIFVSLALKICIAVVLLTPKSNE